MTAPAYKYIDADVTITTGEQARDLLVRENDQPFLSEAGGVIRVSRERWQRAQSAERTHWFVHSLTAVSDRNEDHFRKFDGYRALRGRRFEHAIELGCGPFTNLRLIAGAARVRRVSLLDPLIESYLDHPHCTYDRRHLYRQSVTWLRAPAWLRRPVGNLKIPRRYPRWHRRLRRLHRLPVERLIAEPIETMPLDRTYDLVVIINVIEHCYDLAQVFDNVLAVTGPGSCIVFADRCYKHESVKQSLGRYYDAAHPLRADGRVLERLLNDHFEPLLSDVVADAAGHDDDEITPWDTHRSVYFIGRRR